MTSRQETKSRCGMACCQEGITRRKWMGRMDWSSYLPQTPNYDRVRIQLLRDSFPAVRKKCEGRFAEKDVQWSPFEKMA